MSQFTLESDASTQHHSEYQKALLELVISRDPIVILSETPLWCGEILGSQDAADLRRPEKTGSWSVAQVIHHLADSEIVWANRLRKVIAEETPTIQGYDQNLWADRLGYESRSPEIALQLFSAARASNVDLLKQLPEDDRRRFGLHGERGRESVELMEKLYAGHDLVHRRQIVRILNSIASTD